MKENEIKLFKAIDELNDKEALSLIELGVNLNAQNEEGESFLMRAAKTENWPLVVQLLLKGADLNLQNIKGETILNQAVNKGYETFSLYLIPRMKNLNTADWEKKKTPLMKAIETGQHKTALKLIENGADLSKQDKEGKSALHLAIYYEQKEIIDALIKRALM